MNINEADQTYSLISKTNKDNLMRISVFRFSQRRSFTLYMNIKIGKNSCEMLD